MRWNRISVRRAHLHARQARLAGAGAGGGTEDIPWVMAWQTWLCIPLPLWAVKREPKRTWGRWHWT